MTTSPNRTDNVYETDDHPHTIAFNAKEETVAFPYHRIDEMRRGQGDRSIEIDCDDTRITIRGSHLGKMWRELCSYRLREVSVSILTVVEKELPVKPARCQVDVIEIHRMDDAMAPPS